MAALTTSLLLLAASTAVYAVLNRLLVNANRILLYLACGFAIGGGWLVLQVVAAASLTIELLATALAFACLCELSIVGLAFSLASISAAILVRLQHAPMTAAQIDAGYSSPGMVQTRIERLLQGGYLQAEGERLTLTGRGRRTVRHFRRLQRFFGHA